MTPDRVKQWQAAHPERMRENRKRWAKANPDREKLHAQKAYRNHKAKCDSRTRAWIMSHPDRRKFQLAASAANERYPGRVTAEEIAQVVARAHSLCCWCGLAVAGRNLTIEHLKPVNDPTVMAVACNRCNARRYSHKGITPPFLEMDVAA